MEREREAWKSLKRLAMKLLEPWLGRGFTRAAGVSKGEGKRMTTSSSATTATATTKGRNQKSVSKFSKGHNGKSKKYEENFSDDEIDACNILRG